MIDKRIQSAFHENSHGVKDSKMKYNASNIEFFSGTPMASPIDVLEPETILTEHDICSDLRDRFHFKNLFSL